MPWFWGGARLDVERIAAALIAIAVCWALIRHGASGLGLVRGWAWTLPAFLLLGWALVQTVPMPRAWVARLSPKAAALQESAFGPEGLSGDAWLRRIEDDARARVPEAPAAATVADKALTLDPDGPAPPKRFTLSLFPRRNARTGDVVRRAAHGVPPRPAQSRERAPRRGLSHRALRAVRLAWRWWAS